MNRITSLCSNACTFAFLNQPELKKRKKNKSNATYDLFMNVKSEKQTEKQLRSPRRWWGNVSLGKLMRKSPSVTGGKLTRSLSVQGISQLPGFYTNPFYMSVHWRITRAESELQNRWGTKTHKKSNEKLSAVGESSGGLVYGMCFCCTRQKPKWVMKSISYSTGIMKLYNNEFIASIFQHAAESHLSYRLYHTMLRMKILLQLRHTHPDHMFRRTNAFTFINTHWLKLSTSFQFCYLILHLIRALFKPVCVLNPPTKAVPSRSLQRRTEKFRCFTEWLQSSAPTLRSLQSYIHGETFIKQIIKKFQKDKTAGAQAEDSGTQLLMSPQICVSFF